MQWTIRNKIMAGFAAVAALLVVLAIANWGMMNTSIAATETARDRGYAGAMLASGIKYHTAQVQHHLSDISATRGSDSHHHLGEAETHAESFRQNVAALTAVYPEKTDELEALSTSFEAFYIEGEAMVQQYTAVGPEAGMAAMKKFHDHADQIIPRLDQLESDMEGQAAAALTAATDRSRQSQSAGLAFAAVALALATAIAYALAGRISRPIVSLRSAAVALAEGDLSPEIEDTGASDELGELGRALSTMIAVWRQMAEAADRLAAGDLSADITPRSDRDVIGTALSTMIRSWRGIINGLRDDSTQLSSTAAQLASSSEELSRSTSSQSDEIGRTSSAVEQMAVTIREVARSAELAAQSATSSSRTAEDGGQLVGNTAVGLQEADEIMHRLRASSEEIGSIVSLIQEIAAQTNLLALNAAIEAAGAGAAGARFDVVAEEIRELAARTSQATGEIAELIGKVQTDTQAAATAISEGASLASQSGEALTEIVRSSASVTDMVQSISTSTEEQSRASEEIAVSLDTMVSGSQQTATATREAAHIGVELSNLAERLKDSAGQFRV